MQRIISLTLIVAMGIIMSAGGVWADEEGFTSIPPPGTCNPGYPNYCSYAGLKTHFMGWFHYNGTTTGVAAVTGLSSGTAGSNYGVYGRSAAEKGVGVYGYATHNSGTNYGVYGKSNSTNGYGVYGYNSSSSGRTSAGVYGSTASRHGRAIYGYARSLTGTNFAVYGWTRSNNGRALYGLASSLSGITYGVHGRTFSPDGYGVYSSGNMKVAGDFTCTGTKAAVVDIKDGESVSLYAEESPENWFADYGSGKLNQGRVVVAIDPTFAQTVNTTARYHVFLTPEGDCRGLYVTNKGKTSFEVRELGSGKADIAFSYRIVAKRKGYEDKRLARVPRDTEFDIAAVSDKSPEALEVALNQE